MLTPWQYYLVFAVVLMILEIFAPGFILFPIGVAFLLASGVAFFIDSLPLHFITFAIGCAFTFWLGHRRQKKGAHIKTGVDALIGHEALVEEEINYEQNTGYVKIYGDSWRARTKHNEIIPAGSHVIVEAIESTQLIVRAKVRKES